MNGSVNNPNFFPRVNTIYVGKHGNDLYPGTTPDFPKITIGAAYTALGAGGFKRIVILDGGVYTEDLDLTLADTLFQIDGPAASLIGQLTLNGSSNNVHINLLNHTLLDADAEYGLCLALSVIGSVNRVVYDVDVVDFLVPSGGASTRLDGILIQPIATVSLQDLELRINAYQVSTTAAAIDVRGIRIDDSATGVEATVVAKINDIFTNADAGDSIAFAVEAGHLTLFVSDIEASSTSGAEVAYDTTTSAGIIRGQIGRIKSGSRNPTNLGIDELNVISRRGAEARVDPTTLPLVLTPGGVFDLVFDEERNDYEVEYDPTTGEYTVKQDGLYNISWALSFTIDPAYAFLVGIAVNGGAGRGSKISTIHLNTTATTNFQVLSGAATGIELSKGDVVTILYSITLVAGPPATGVTLTNSAPDANSATFRRIS